MEATWGKKVRKSLLIIGGFVVVLTAFGMVALVQSASAAAKSIPTDIELARDMGMSPNPDELKWDPTPGPDNAWPTYLRFYEEWERLANQADLSFRRGGRYLVDRDPEPWSGRFDRAVLNSLMEASLLPRCHFPIESTEDWAGTYRFESMVLYRVGLYGSVAAVDARARGDHSLAQQLSLAMARLARQVGQGMTRESVWARSGIENLAIQSACRVVEGLPGFRAAEHLENFLEELGPVPAIRHSLRGELARTFARISTSRYFLTPQETMPETLWKKSLQGRALSYYVTNLAKLQDQPDTVLDDYRTLEEIDKQTRDPKRLLRAVPSDLRRVASQAAIGHQRRRQLRQLVDWLRTGNPPREPDLYGRELRADTSDGFALKSLGLDGEEGDPGWETFSRRNGDDILTVVRRALPGTRSDG